MQNYLKGEGINFQDMYFIHHQDILLKAVRKWRHEVYVGIAFASIVLGFLLMVPVAMLFDLMNWPLFHSWGLIHGSFLLAWPMLTVLSFGIIQAIRMRIWP